MILIFPREEEENKPFMTFRSHDPSFTQHGRLSAVTLRAECEQTREPPLSRAWTWSLMVVHVRSYSSHEPNYLHISKQWVKILQFLERVRLGKGSEERKKVGGEKGKIGSGSVERKKAGGEIGQTFWPIITNIHL